MTQKMFDDELLEAFMNNFYGYGNYQGDFWFIGMEEHCSNSFEAVQSRLNVWQKRGKHELEDVAGYHIELGIPEPFRDKKPKLQKTWNALIRILLSINNGVPPTHDEVLAYQKNLWARQNGNECLLELFPLPSRSTSDWLYVEHSNLPNLVSRERYEQVWANPGIKRLKNLIETYHPKVVVFYSFKYRKKYWKEIVGSNLTLAHASEKLYTYRKERTLFVVVKHPRPRRSNVPNSYFDQVGQFIKSELSKH